MDRSKYKEILAGAIEREIEAQRFYRDVAGRMKDDFLKELFAGFVEEEKKHQEILEGFMDSVPENIPFDETRDYRVSETVESPEVSAGMKPADAFSLAMKKEEEAMNQYNALADGCIDPDQEKVFRRLAAMERDHKFRIENAFVDIGYPEVW
ncbi:MAG: ferritin-like domain-containing protein [Thermodesulfobacteriota bacterium]